MAVTNMIAGSISLTTTSWEDGSGFGTAANELIIGSGTQNISASLDQSGAQVIKSLTISQQYSGNIGDGSNPMKFYATDTSAAEKTSANTEAFFLNRGSGQVYFACGTTASTNSVDNVIHAGSGKLTVVSGTVPWLTCTNGSVVVKAVAVVQNLKVYGGTVTVEDGAATNMSTITIYGGTVILKRPVSVGSALITVNGGTLIYAYDNATGTATTTVTQNGGQFVHKAGPVTTHNHNAGMHDYADMYRNTTIGTCIRTPAAKFNGQRAGNFLTVTTDTTKDFPVFTG